MICTYGVEIGSKGGDVRHDHDLESGIHRLGRGEHQMQLTTGICRLIDRHDIECETGDTTGDSGGYLVLHVYLPPMRIGTRVDRQRTLAQ